jgi:hypothetical protein
MNNFRNLYSFPPFATVYSEYLRTGEGYTSESKSNIEIADYDAFWSLVNYGDKTKANMSSIIAILSKLGFLVKKPNENGELKYYLTNKYIGVCFHFGLLSFV